MTRLAKFGLEVEGQFLGLRTVFCEAQGLPEVLKHLDAIKSKYGVEHLYIGSAESLTQADYDRFANLGLIVTVEVTEAPKVVRPDNVRYMIAVHIDPRKLGLFNPGAYDQVKFTYDQYVACAPSGAFVLSKPEDFEKDIEFTEDDLKK